MISREQKQRLIDATTLLNIPGVGRGRYTRLVSAFGGAAEVLKAGIAELERVSGISRAIASEIKRAQDKDAAAQITARIVQLGWTVSFLGDDDYPEALATIDSAPPVLFSIGHAFSECSPRVAIVGTRNASERGKLFAHSLAAGLVRAGVTVVSGMADGIDSAAHRGALETGGRTIAVWGSSLDIIYPPTNKNLADQIKTSGVICSDYFPGTSPDRSSFPERNRIISGLSSGVVVIEAGKKSGALLTADHALEQGRELFAVPGHPEFSGAVGTNALIKKGAKLVTSVEDIFDELPGLKGKVVARKAVKLPEMTDTERKIIDLFSDEPLQIDKISRSVKLPVSDTLEFMLALELKGVVRELSGKRFVLAEDLT